MMKVYTKTIVDDEKHCMDVMKKMEYAFKEKNESYFIDVISREPSLVLRVHAVCILAEIGHSKAVEALSDVLLNDPDPLVRHEAAFSLGQIGLSSGNRALEAAVRRDSEAIVRHEAAAALGSIGNPSAEGTLQSALNDGDVIVRNSAKASLFNLDFLRRYSVGPTARDRAPRP